MLYPRMVLSAALLLAAMLALSAVAEGRGGGKARASGSSYEKVVFIDRGQAFRGGAGPRVATDAAEKFRRTQGGIHWPGTPETVEYSVSTAGCADDCGAAVDQVNAGFDAWEVSGVTFTQDNATPDANPCTGAGNSVSWAAIDGSGAALAYASVCRNVKTKAIVGFEIVFDSGDTWSDSGDGGRFDIAATSAHESGHGIGLGHVNGPRNARLTMAPTIAAGDTGARTLGCGDRLGVNALYGAGLDCTGLPGD